MRFHITNNFQPVPWGGCNQFLKALKKEFEIMECYEENPEETEAILFNSYFSGSEYLFERILNIKQRYPNKIIIYRLDGPISVFRGKNKELDEIIKLFNKLFVDGIVFQSDWCKKQNKKLFGISSKYDSVIYNAPNNEIFNRHNKKELNPEFDSLILKNADFAIILLIFIIN